MKKLLFGLIAGLLMLATGMVTGRVFQYFAPFLKDEYENPDLFRSWQDPLMLLYFIEPFLLGIILAWLWTKTLGILKGETWLIKGISFAFIYWVITLPGMLMSISSFPVSAVMVLSWTISSLVQLLFVGILFSKFLR